MEEQQKPTRMDLDDGDEFPLRNLNTEELTSSLEEIYNTLQCNICYEWPNRYDDLLLCSVYGHVVCERCTNRLEGNPKKCPMRCGGYFTANQIKHRNLPIKAIYSVFTRHKKAKCPYYQFGCLFTCAQDELERHKSQCMHQPVLCNGYSCTMFNSYEYFVNNPRLHCMGEKNDCYELVKPRSDQPNAWTIVTATGCIYQPLSDSFTEAKTRSMILRGQDDLSKENNVRLGLQCHFLGDNYVIRPIWLESRQRGLLTRTESIVVEVTAGCSRKLRCQSFKKAYTYRGPPTFQDEERDIRNYFPITNTKALILQKSMIATSNCSDMCPECYRNRFLKLMYFNVKLISGQTLCKDDE